MIPQTAAVYIVIMIEVVALMEHYYNLSVQEIKMFYGCVSDYPKCTISSSTVLRNV
uniref:Uncharacterized protein n=1 Tax=Arion vulgaris TaxID=1028688 RepID=A0A0B6ZRH0_9EUPU